MKTHKPDGFSEHEMLDREFNVEENVLKGHKHCGTDNIIFFTNFNLLY